MSADVVADRSANADWDTLFMQSRAFALTALKIFFAHKKNSINRVRVGNWATVRAVACDVMCTDSYKKLFEQRVRQMSDALGPGAELAPGGEPSAPPSRLPPPPVPVPNHSEAALREAIISNALRMHADPKIQAKTRGADGLRQGWQKLKAIFELAAPGYNTPGWEENILKRSLVVGPAGIPHWCGIFAVWATKAAGVPVGTWQIGRGVSQVKGFRQIGASQVRKSDIGYVEAQQHHFLVREVYPNGTVDTVEGNSDATSTTSTKKRATWEVKAFYSAF